MIFDNFQLDITRYATLPSLAFALYRAKFMPGDAQIPKLLGNIYNDIAQAYRGGFVDVYKPFAENVKSYDVNSLYPSAMANNPVPVGAPIYFEGNPLKYLSQDEMFGYFYVEVQTPKDMKVPILQHTITENGAKRIVCPLGNWTG